jgi:hypothetical protein
MHHVQLRFNLTEPVIHLNRVLRPSKLQRTEPVEIRNAVDVRIWVVLNISLPDIVLVHHSIC